MPTAKRRVCRNEICSKRLPASASPSQRYCTVRCRNNQNQRNWRRRHTQVTQHRDTLTALTKGEDYEVPENLDSFARRGPVYEKIANDPSILFPLLDGTMSHRTAAELLGCETSTVTRALATLKYEVQKQTEAEAWTMSGDHERLLGPLHMPPPDTPQWDLTLDEMVSSFVKWRDQFMTDAKGNPYITRGFHRAWIRAILEAIFTGGRQMILSPPRHGKTQLLIDFCIWQICRDPNIRILWIAANGQLVEDWISAIEDQLENNEGLRRAYLAPGQDWKPQSRSGKSWSRSQFTIATRTVTGIGGATMTGIGREGRILSRNVDFMIVDDIEDHGSTVQPGSRENTRKWFATEAGSRKEETTAVVVIGSRQHPDDLYGHLIQNPEWSVIVEEAHQSSCTKDPLDETLHIDCMLFSELRSYTWLMGQKRSFEITGGESLFLMVYQNVAMAEGLVIFDIDEMKKCYTSRDIGQIPPAVELVAGLDPAIAGFQAAVLWGYQRTTDRFFLIDLDNTPGAGIPGWRDLIQKWFDTYNLRHWVVEDTAAQRGYMQDDWVVKFKNANHVHIEGHHTSTNKWDSHYGVSAMARLFNEEVHWQNPNNQQTEILRRVDLPYGTPAAKSKIDLFIAQAAHFSAVASANRNTRRGYKADVIMAAWFPMKAIRRWRKERAAELVWEYEPTFQGLVPTDWNEPPWGRMNFGR